MSDAVTVHKPRDVIHIDSTFVPHHLVWLHRMARIGKASRYGNWQKPGQLNSACQFDITPEMAEKWPALTDIERVTILYREKEG